MAYDEGAVSSEEQLKSASPAKWYLSLCPVLQHFQKVIPHQLDSGPDKVIQAAYQVKYNGKKMKK